MTSTLWQDLRYGAKMLWKSKGVTLVAVYFTRETKGIDLASVDQADREDLAKAAVG